MIKKLLLFAAVALIACDKNTTEPNEDPSIALSPDSLTVAMGSTALVGSAVTNTTAATEFMTRNSAVATVNATGTVSGVGAGTTWIIGTLVGMPSIKDSVKVVVTQTGGGGQQPIVLPLLGTGLVTERYTAEVAALGTVAYTTTWGSRQALGNAIKVWNVAGNTPVLVDSIILAGVGTVSDIQISDDGTLLVASTEASGLSSGNNGIFIFNRTNATRPAQIIKYTSANTAQGVHTVKLGRVNGRHYAFLNIDPAGSTPAKLVIVDITNPAAPTEVFVQNMGNPFIHDVFVRDGILMAGLWNDGMRIFDIGGANRGGTPSAPVALGTVRTTNCRVCAPGSSSVHNIWWFHDPTNNSKRYAFIGEEGPGSVGSQVSRGALHVVDVSDFNNPVEVAIYEPDTESTANQQNAGAHNFVMDEQSGILYAAFYNGGVRAIDVRGDLGACTAAQRSTAGLCDLKLMGREVGIGVSSGPPKYVWGVARVGTSLYASDMLVGLHKLNIAGLQR
jgi:hypothetical protein